MLNKAFDCALQPLINFLAATTLAIQGLLHADQFLNWYRWSNDTLGTMTENLSGHAGIVAESVDGLLLLMVLLSVSISTVLAVCNLCRWTMLVRLCVLPLLAIVAMWLSAAYWPALALAMHEGAGNLISQLPNNVRVGTLNLGIQASVANILMMLVISVAWMVLSFCTALASHDWGNARVKSNETP